MDHIADVECHQGQCQVAQDAMDIGPKRDVNDLPWRCVSCSATTRTVSSNAIFTIFLKLQDTKIPRTCLAGDEV
ncbi:unnamed protein product [Strongylus vulgaris]|uniref:Uncharacterized protein n=1 Tax=Strongylus vulgaris TaxID=40348 RepID=A0A3P7KXW1_STRVU|nr:unnamed protein product [Strongylus vulgaris]